MPKWGWRKRIKYEQVFEHPRHKGVPVLMEWYLDAKRYPCYKCRSSERTWFLIPPHDYAGGIFLGCSKCRRVYGPLDLEEASYDHQDMGQITIRKLVEICERTHQPIPSKRLLDRVNALSLGESVEQAPRPLGVGEKPSKKRGRPQKEE